MATRKEISDSLSSILDDEYQGSTRIHRELHQKIKSGKTNVIDYLLAGKYATEKIKALREMIGAATVRSLAAEVLRQYVEESSSSGQIKTLINRWDAIPVRVRREFFGSAFLPACLSNIGFQNIANHLHTSGALGPQPRKLSALESIYQGAASALGE